MNHGESSVWLCLVVVSNGAIVRGSSETIITNMDKRMHDDVIKWKHFPRYWPFVWGIHRSRWIPRTKASNAELWCFGDLRMKKRLSKQSQGRWFKTQSCSLWRQCNVTWIQYAQVLYDHNKTTCNKKNVHIYEIYVKVPKRDVIYLLTSENCN